MKSTQLKLLTHLKENKRMDIDIYFYNIKISM